MQMQSYNMNITDAQYYLNDDGNNQGIMATIDGKVLYVPVNTGNRHYQAIQEWVAEGNTIAEAD